MHHCIPLGYTALFRELTTNMMSILGANNMLNFIHLIREGTLISTFSICKVSTGGCILHDNSTNLSNICSVSIVSADVLKLNAQ